MKINNKILKFKNNLFIFVVNLQGRVKQLPYIMNWGCVTLVCRPQFVQILFNHITYNSVEFNQKKITDY